MSKKKIYLHIGFEKCASKTIQSALLTVVTNYKFRIESLDEYTNSNIREMIKSNINSDFILISDERLSWGVDNTNEIVNMIIEISREFGLDLKFILVYRNFFEYLQSLYCEYLKWGGQRLFIDFCMESKSAQTYDYRLRGLKIDIEDSHILKLDSNVLCNFFRLLGVEYLDFSRFAVNNKRLSPGVSKILYEYNRDNNSKLEEERVLLCRNLITVLPEHFIYNFGSSVVFPKISQSDLLRISNRINQDSPLTLSSLDLDR
jgi:hypothetical protein